MSAYLEIEPFISDHEAAELLDQRRVLACRLVVDAPLCKVDQLTRVKDSSFGSF